MHRAARPSPEFSHNHLPDTHINYFLHFRSRRKHPLCLVWKSLSLNSLFLLLGVRSKYFKLIENVNEIFLINVVLCQSKLVFWMQIRIQFFYGIYSYLKTGVMKIHEYLQAILLCYYLILQEVLYVCKIGSGTQSQKSRGLRSCSGKI